MLNENTVGRGETVYCALFIATYNGGGAIKAVLNAKNSIDKGTITE